MLPPMVSLANEFENDGLFENHRLKVGSADPLAIAS